MEAPLEACMDYNVKKSYLTGRDTSACWLSFIYLPKNNSGEKDHYRNRNPLHAIVEMMQWIKSEPWCEYFTSTCEIFTLRRIMRQVKVARTTFFFFTPDVDSVSLGTCKKTQKYQWSMNKHKQKSPQNSPVLVFVRVKKMSWAWRVEGPPVPPHSEWAEAAAVCQRRGRSEEEGCLWEWHPANRRAETPTKFMSSLDLTTTFGHLIRADRWRRLITDWFADVSVECLLMHCLSRLI